MKENWAEILKQKLEGHRKTPPAGLWEGISKEMGVSPAPSRRGGYWAAAAVILLLVGLFVFNEKGEEQPPQAEMLSLPPTSQKAEETDSIKYEATTTAPVPAVAQASSLHRATKQKEEKTIRQETKPMTADSVTLTDETTAQVAPSESEHTPTKGHRPHQDKVIRKLPEDWLTRKTSIASSHKWSLGVNASGSLLAAQTQHTNQLNKYEILDEVFNKGYSTDAGESAPVSMSQINYVTKHHLPIRFGLTLNYQLTPRIALLSGISYTYLHSRFSIPIYQNISYDQKLHYLGIPLGVSCKLWSNRHFQFYVSGGAMLEKCLNDNPWQWSVDAAVGAEYVFIRQLGFYVEPSIGYYFNDGTSLQHYYKEHPWAPSIDFGIRLHLAKP